MSALPAVVEVAAETETAFGGRLRAWSAVATVWVALARPQAREEASPPDAPAVRTEAATATCRTHPALAAGVRLRTGEGPPWRVLAVHQDDPAPGRMRLTLDRLL